MRMTRAAARAEAEIHEDESDIEATEATEAVEVPLPQTPQHALDVPQLSPQRAPLGEITLNEKEEEPKILLEVNMSKPTKKGKSKKGKGSKKAKKVESDKENEHDSEGHGSVDDQENTPEVLEDDVQSRPSSAASEACADLLKETKATLKQIKHDMGPSTPPSKAVRMARKQITPKPQTPRFNPEVHRSPEVVHTVEQEADSFVESIETRSPAKVTAEPVVEDDIVPSTTTPSLSPSRSPRRSPRIEDSIEEIDAAAEALEKLGSIVEDAPSSPAKTRKATATPSQAKAERTTTKKAALKPASARTLTTKKSVSELSKTSTIRRSTTHSIRNASPTKAPLAKAITKPLTPRLATTRTTAVQPKVAATRPAPGSKPTITKRKVSSVTSAVSSKPPTKALTLPTRPKARVTSINKAPFVPQKSSKPPTQSSFTLPGEAIAARLKEQREKRQEGAAAAATAYQASAVKAATIGRATTRSSLASAKVGAGGTVRMPKAPRATILPEKRIASNTSTDSMAVNVDGESIKATQRSSTLGRANVSAPRTSVLPSGSNSAVSRASASTLKSRTSMASRTMPAQRAKVASISGQEVFARMRNGMDAQAQAKKDKEEAAKKARAEAAERGRQASREWAEKMKVRQTASKASKPLEASA